jgi:Na+/serine symporter
VLLGPLRAISYIFLHGILAATLGSLWRYHASWWVSVPLGALVRMAGQLAYLVLSSVTMNENLFAVMLSNVHALLDQISAALGTSGAPSTTAVVSMIFALLLVNSFCYVFLLHVVYRIALVAMGFKMGPLPGIVRKYLYGNYAGPV